MKGLLLVASSAQLPHHCLLLKCRLFPNNREPQTISPLESVHKLYFHRHEHKHPLFPFLKNNLPDKGISIRGIHPLAKEENF